MKKIEWKDETIYSRSDKDRIPQTWSLGERHKLEIIITHYLYDREHWYLNCRKLGISDKLLKYKNLEKAKKEALLFVRKRIDKLIKEFESLGE